MNREELMDRYYALDKKSRTKLLEKASIRRKKDRLLEKLVSQRMARKLDTVLRGNKAYRKAVRQQDTAFSNMEKPNLDKNQRIIIDRVISANNHCGAMYGIATYRLGLQDGIKLMSEVNEIVK